MAQHPDKRFVSTEDLLRLSESILSSAGYSPENARQTAELLVWANARGIDSHGVLRIPRYIEMVQTGQMNGRAEPFVSSAFGATSILEGSHAPGAAAMNMAIARAVDAARSYGIGWCSARNITHAGAVGYFAEKAAASDCIGIVMAASKPLMTYHGSRSEAVSTNPLAIAAPNPKGGHPVILDMSTSAVALGKIMVAKETGAAIPLGWGIDANGAETTDPKAVKSLLPMAGPKGSGLSLMIEILSSVLVGNPIISVALGGSSNTPFNGLALAINIAAFGNVGAFYEGMAALGAAIKALPLADGVDQIMLPGERGAEAGRGAAVQGIALEAATAAKLVKIAIGYGIEPPHSMC